MTDPSPWSPCITTAPPPPRPPGAGPGGCGRGGWVPPYCRHVVGKLRPSTASWCPVTGCQAQCPEPNPDPQGGVARPLDYPAPPLQESPTRRVHLLLRVASHRTLFNQTAHRTMLHVYHYATRLIVMTRKLETNAMTLLMASGICHRHANRHRNMRCA